MKKICLLCQEEKEVSDFYIRNGKSHARCKYCINQINREWYSKNQEKKLSIINSGQKTIRTKRNRTKENTIIKILNR